MLAVLGCDDGLVVPFSIFKKMRAVERCLLFLLSLFLRRSKGLGHNPMNKQDSHIASHFTIALCISAFAGLNRVGGLPKSALLLPLQAFSRHYFQEEMGNEQRDNNEGAFMTISMTNLN